jgi:hypothetical protein
MVHYLPLVKIVYYVMRSKNEVLCAETGSLAAERSAATTSQSILNKKYDENS